MYSVFAFLTSDRLFNLGVTSVSILISIPVALYIDRFARRRRTGEDFEYGLHLLRVVKVIKDETMEHNTKISRQNEWDNILKRTTKQINDATVDSSYKKTYKKHRRQLEEVCYQLAKWGALRSYIQEDKLDAVSEETPDSDRFPDSGWFKGRSWEISSLGEKVLNRTLRRESFDERIAAFELYYRTGILPSAIQGEEHGRHHREYLEYLLPDRDGEGGYVVRDDDQEVTSFLMRVGISNFDSEFRYVEFSSTENFYSEGDPTKIREAVDKAWPSEGLSLSRTKAEEILRSSDHDLHNILSLYQNAIETIYSDIIKTWPGSGTPIDYKVDSDFVRILMDFIQKAGEELDEDLDDLKDLQKLNLEENKSRVKAIVDSDSVTPDKVSKLNRVISDEQTREFKLPKWPKKVEREDLTLEAWIVMIPKEVKTPV